MACVRCVCVCSGGSRGQFNIFDYKKVWRFRQNPASVCLFKVNNRKTRKWCEISSKLSLNRDLSGIPKIKNRFTDYDVIKPS